MLLHEMVMYTHTIQSRLSLLHNIVHYQAESIINPDDGSADLHYVDPILDKQQNLNKRANSLVTIIVADVDDINLLVTA